MTGRPAATQHLQDLARLRRVRDRAYRARDHEELRAVAACQAMVLTRPRRSAGRRRAQASSFGEAPVTALA